MRTGIVMIRDKQKIWTKICEEKSTKTESVDLEMIEHITCVGDFGCFILFVVL